MSGASTSFTTLLAAKLGVEAPRENTAWATDPTIVVIASKSKVQLSRDAFGAVRLSLVVITEREPLLAPLNAAVRDGSTYIPTGIFTSLLRAQPFTQLHSFSCLFDPTILEA
ncbi:hypothetical protein RB195_002491 [Necator americanus]|uniref:Uncharacterized protein n=1 Tax=Necator americanus TaxID=51031 RepID=A0ABR1DJM0_NECAM